MGSLLAGIGEKEPNTMQPDFPQAEFIELVDGWLHPLAQEPLEHESKQVIDLWRAASMLVAGATERIVDADVDRDICISRLIQLGVLDLQTDYSMRLTVCKNIDAGYLKLVSEAKNALDNKFDDAFRRKTE